MKPTGFYKLSQTYIDLIALLGGKYRDNKERPVYCCLRDRKNPGIYWAIPTSDISHRTPEQLDRIKRYCALPERDIRSCFYHLGHTNRPAIFKISSVLPVTEAHLAGEYISQGIHLVLKNKTHIDAITRKLSRILFDESVHPDKYEQHITTIYNHIAASLARDESVIDSERENGGQPLESKRPSVLAQIKEAKQKPRERASAPQKPKHKNEPER